MKIEATSVKKLRLTEVESLDPIDVILEDIAPRQGKITISCWGKSWTASWGGMGDRSIAEFFCSCDYSYLIGNLAPGLRCSVTDFEKVKQAAETELKQQAVEVLKKRREEYLSEDSARDSFDEISDILLFGVPDFWSEAEVGNWEHVERVFGEEWWHYDFPTKANSDYEYLERVVAAVQAGLNQHLAPKAA